MSDIVKLVPKKHKTLPDNTADFLRKIADDVESGALTELVMACVRSGEYEMIKSSSCSDSLVLANLLHDSCIRDFHA